MRQRSSNVKIVAGKFKGQKIPFKVSKNIRPTANKTRETIFNWLMYDTEGSVCLDMFAGTGALGLEALSRGSCFVYFAEKNRKIFKDLNHTVSNLGLQDKTLVMNVNSLNFPFKKKIHQPLDIIFIDPPFRKGFFKKACVRLKDQNLISDKTIVCAEIEKEMEFEESFLGWNLYKSETQGQTNYSLYRIK